MSGQNVQGHNAMGQNMTKQNITRRVITDEMLLSFEKYLFNNEKGVLTVEKYMRDVRKFKAFAGGRAVEKHLTVEYKAYLEGEYAVRSANSMIASLNSFLRFMEWNECCVKQFKVQRQIFCPEEKELSKAEYGRLVAAAKKSGNEKLNLILQTICGTGIRVSELQFITVSAVQKGEAVVQCKGKTRVVFIVKELRSLLLQYVRKHGIESGCVFVTKSGKPMNRTVIWRDMKSICRQAGVEPQKVFPHNLRHLFARTFYGIEKDIAKLADILGHSSINTTRIYIITTGEEHKKKMESMRLIM